MVKATFTKSKIVVTGHAEYALAGQDIVCSGISALVQFVANIYESENIGFFTQKSGDIIIQIKNNNEFSDKLYHYLIEALKGLEKDYPNHLKVEVK